MSRTTIIIVGVSLALCHLGGCGSGREVVAPDPTPEEASLKARIESQIVRLEKHKENDEMAIPFTEAVENMVTTIVLWRKYGDLRFEYEVLQENAGLDLQVAAGERDQAERERDRARQDRWIWGSIGLILGLVLGVGGMVLAN